MGRKRKIKSKTNIKYVHEANGRIVYRPYIPADKRGSLPTDKGGFLKPPIRLGSSGDDPDQIMAAYIAAKESLKQKQKQIHTLRWTVEKYIQSRQHKELAPSSQKNNSWLSRCLDHPLKINKKKSNLGDISIEKITKPLMQQIAEIRLKKYQEEGKSGIVTVNHEMTLISTAISWATNYIHEFPIQKNPMSGFKKFTTPKNNRYVTDSEYAIQYNHAIDHSPAYLPIIFEITYLTAARGAETLDIKISDCTEQGIHIHRRKNSRDTVIKWSPRLKAAFDKAVHLNSGKTITPLEPYLISGANGEKMNIETVKSAMSRLKKSMRDHGLIDVFWTLHALKHKAITESDDKNIAGHRSESMKQLYDQSIASFKPPK